MRPRFSAISLAPEDWYCAEGNLLVTMAMVLGGFDVEARASNTVVGIDFWGSGPKDAVGKCISYFARCGIPNEWWT